MIPSDRRKFLKTTGAAITTVSLAGCGGNGGGGGSNSLDKIGMTAHVRGGSYSNN